MLQTALIAINLSIIWAVTAKKVFLEKRKLGSWLNWFNLGWINIINDEKEQKDKLVLIFACDFFEQYPNTNSIKIHNIQKLWYDFFKIILL